MHSTRSNLLSEVSVAHLSSSVTPLAVYTRWSFQPPCVQCTVAVSSNWQINQSMAAPANQLWLATQAGLPCRAPSAGSQTAWCTPLPAMPAYTHALDPAGKEGKGGLGVELWEQCTNTQQLSIHGHLPPPGSASPPCTAAAAHTWKAAAATETSAATWCTAISGPPKAG